MTADTYRFVAGDRNRLEAGADARADSPADAPSDGASGEAGPDADAGKDAPSPIDRSCVGLSLGNFCGRTLASYKGNAQDLVRCLGDGGMGAVVPCTSGCFVMPTGRRDICNACVGTARGTYCVQQLVPDYNVNDVRIACSANVVTTSGANAPKICTSGCGDSGMFGDCL